MIEAGYPNGFSVDLHCPNDRYINDEAICQAFVGMLGRIGIRAKLVSQSTTLHFPLIRNRETDFHLLGWGVPTFGSAYVFDFLIHSRDDTRGSWNGSHYSNPEIGVSYRMRQPVMELILSHLPATLELALVSGILAFVLGVGFGVYTALRRRGALTNVIMTVSLIGVSLPTFLIGVLLIWVFAIELPRLSFITWRQPTFGRGEVVDLGWWTTGSRCDLATGRRCGACGAGSR